MIAFVLKDAATGMYCGGVDTGRKSVLVTAHLDHAEAWADQAGADTAAAALAGASGAFDWRVVQRHGDVAARLLGRLLAGPASMLDGGRPLRAPGEMTEGQFYGVRELVRLLGVAVRHIDRQIGVLDEAGVRIDMRPFQTLYDRLGDAADPFHALMLAHFDATIPAQA